MPGRMALGQCRTNCTACGGLRDGNEIAYGYDPEGNLTSLAPPGRPAHTFTYNALGLDSIYDPPDVAGVPEDRTFYTYNLDRDLTQILRPDGLSVDFAYDTAGRVDAVTIPRGTVDYAYSATTGQLTGITAPGAESLSFAYDGSLPTQESWTGTVSGQVGFAYDADFRLSGLAVNADTVAYGYDQDGLLTQAGDLALTRDPLNGLLTETQLDSVTTRQSYNAFGELAADSAWVGSTLVFARTYTRDDLGRITQVVDVADGVTTTWGYGYDLAGRLETVTQNGQAFASYEYDANGNRLSRTSPSGVESGTYDAQDRLVSYAGASYSYTAAGELEEKIQGADTTRYSYDVLGNLTEVTLSDGTLIEYVIDGRNRRVGKIVDGSLVQGFLYGDQLNPVAELDSLGNVVSRFVYGSKANVPDYVVKGGETFRVISDHLGSVRMVVHVTTGAVVQRLSYDAWGRVLEDTNPGWQPFGFVGGLYDADVELVRFGARDYSSVEGRWTAKDPLRFEGSDPNLYTYVLGNPLGYVDLTGERPCGTGFTSEECRRISLAIHRLQIHPFDICRAIGSAARDRYERGGYVNVAGIGAAGTSHVRRQPNGEWQPWVRLHERDRQTPRRLMEAIAHAEAHVLCVMGHDPDRENDYVDQVGGICSAGYSFTWNRPYR